MIRGTEPLLGNCLIRGRGRGKKLQIRLPAGCCQPNRRLAASGLFGARDPALGFTISIATTWKVTHRETART